MIQEFKKIWKSYAIGLLWLLGLLWPLLGIHPDGTLSFGKTFTVWLYIATGSFICLLMYLMNKSGNLKAITGPMSVAGEKAGAFSGTIPIWIWLGAAFVLACLFPVFTSRDRKSVV